jgi:hypothetical protein
MNRDDIQKLLGGYATGTLTPEEQEALFAAALDDQELFDQLAREQALRDLLRDPVAKAQVLAALDEVPLRWYQQLGRWMARPAGMGLAAACFLAIAGYVGWQAGHPRQPLMVAEVKREAVPPAPVPAPPEPQPKPAAAPPQPAKASRVVPQAVTRFEEMGARGGAAGGVVGGVPGAATRGTLGAVTAGAQTTAPAAPPLPSPPPASAVAEQVVVAPAPSALAGAKPDAPAAVNAPLSARSLYFGSRQPEADGAKGLARPTVQPTASEMAGAVRPMATGRVQLRQAAAAPANLGVAWSVWRREPGGGFAKADAEDLRAGEAVQLRIVPNDSGFLSVMEGRPGQPGSRVLAANQRVERLVPFETGALTADAPGPKEYTVLFSRQPLNAPGQPAEGDQLRNNLVRTAAEQQQSEKDVRGHDTYVVQTGTAAPALPVLVTIRLNYR